MIRRFLKEEIFEAWGEGESQNLIKIYEDKKWSSPSPESYKFYLTIIFQAKDDKKYYQYVLEKWYEDLIEFEKEPELVEVK